MFLYVLHIPAMGPLMLFFHGCPHDCPMASSQGFLVLGEFAYLFLGAQAILQAIFILFVSSHTLYLACFQVATDVAFIYRLHVLSYLLLVSLVLPIVRRGLPLDD